VAEVALVMNPPPPPSALTCHPAAVSRAGTLVRRTDRSRLGPLKAGKGGRAYRPAASLAAVIWPAPPKSVAPVPGCWARRGLAWRPNHGSLDRRDLAGACSPRGRCWKALKHAQDATQFRAVQFRALGAQTGEPQPETPGRSAARLLEESCSSAKGLLPAAR